MAKKNSTKTATKEALQASEPRVQTFSQWNGMYIKESPYGWTTDYEFERHGHVQNQTDLKPNFLMIQDNVISTSTKSLETRNETQLVSTAPYDEVDGDIVQREFTGVTCLVDNILYAAFDDGSIRYFNLDDAPHAESNTDPQLTRWTLLQAFDKDNPTDPLVNRHWTSINYVNGQLVCMTRDPETGAGEIYSGYPDAFIASAIRIPDPTNDDSGLNEESRYIGPNQDPHIKDKNTGTISNYRAYQYNANKLYIRSDNTLIGITEQYPNAAIENQKTIVLSVTGYADSSGWTYPDRDANDPDYPGGNYMWVLYEDPDKRIPITIEDIEERLGFTLQSGSADSIMGYDPERNEWYFIYKAYPDSEHPGQLDPHYRYGYELRFYEWYQNHTPTVVEELPHRLQFVYTYSNKYGQTLASNWKTVWCNLSPLIWSSATGGLVISQTVPRPSDYVHDDPEHPGDPEYYIHDYDETITDFEITGVDIYYTKDDNLDMVFCGHVENVPSPGLEWEYTWYGAYSDLSEWTNVSLTVPSENTTKGVDAAYMNVHDGRCYFFGGSLPYRLWIGGRVGNELSVATGVGGAYVDIEPGSGMEVNNTHKFKTYNGANIVTIMCGHPNTHQVRRFNLVQTNITLTNELSAAGWMTEEVSNVVGCLSHHGSGVWAQGLYTLSRYGLACTTQQMENSNNLRAQLVSDAIQPIFTESLASALKNTQMIFIDDVIYFALAKGPQYLNCGLIGKEFDPNELYYTRDEYQVIPPETLRNTVMQKIIGFYSRSENKVVNELDAIIPPYMSLNKLSLIRRRIGTQEQWLYPPVDGVRPIILDQNWPVRQSNIARSGVYIYQWGSNYDDRTLWELNNGWRSAESFDSGEPYYYYRVNVTVDVVYKSDREGAAPIPTTIDNVICYLPVSDFRDLFNDPVLDPEDFINIAWSRKYMLEAPVLSQQDLLHVESYTVHGTWGLDVQQVLDTYVMNQLYYKEGDNFINAQGTEFDPSRTYYQLKERHEQFDPVPYITKELYYDNIYRCYIQEAVLDDIIFAYDVNSQAWYTFTYQPNLIESAIDDFGPDTPQDTTTDPEVYSTAIKSLINFDSQSSPEGIGIVTTDRIDLIPTAGIVDNAPSYIYDAEHDISEIAVPNFVAHIETGELSTSSPPQQFHTLSQLEFRFDYFFGDIDIDIEGVDYYGRTFHIHKDVTYDYIQQDLAVYVRVDYIVNTYNIKIKGRAHFRLTHVMAKVYPESRKINLVYGFDDSSLYKKRHGGTQFTHHYIKDYNNLRRALEP